MTIVCTISNVSRMASARVNCVFYEANGFKINIKDAAYIDFYYFDPIDSQST
jgi:hypothetical protein